MVVMIKGAGEKASAVACLLFKSGYGQIVMTEQAVPTVERRAVAFCEAVWAEEKTVEGVVAVLCNPDPDAVRQAWQNGRISVVVDPGLKILPALAPDCFIDAVLAKRNTGTHTGLASLVIGLGPGFTAGKDVHRVIETDPASPDLGRVISSGRAASDTGRPTAVNGLTHQRLLHSPAEGRLKVLKDIGHRARCGQAVAEVAGKPVKAKIDGVVWGLVRSGTLVRAGTKVGDIDPRNDPKLCRMTTPQAMKIARGVLEAINRLS